MEKEEPIYSPQEEFANALTHAIGALLSIYGIVMLSVYSNTPVETASTAIYGAMMFILFQASTCYHSMTNETAKKVFRKIDHSAIYLLIAGTYTPMLLLTVDFPHSVALLAMIWYLAFTGIIFSCLTLKYKSLSTGLYALMGWLSVFLVWNIWKIGGVEAIWYLIGGGLFYTVGCIFYMRKKPFMHSIWHIFVLLGAIMHYFAVLSLLKP